jgi:hypothetical protein
MEPRIKGATKRIFSNIPLTIFLRTFLVGVGSIFLWTLILMAWFYLGLLSDGSEFLFSPLIALACCIGYIHQAKKRYGDGWSIGVSGILGIFTVVICFVVLLGTSIR